MSEWQDVVIEELCSEITDCVNKTAPSVDYVTPYKMIRTTNIKQGRINLDEVRYVTEETYKTWIRRGAPQLEDIILTREAPVGEVGMIRTSEKVFLGQRTMMYRADRTKADPYFLYYAFQTEAVQEQIHSAGMGSVVEHVRVPDAKKFKINTPPLPEQKAIASVLSSLDDKIDLLHRQNKTLEAMAETLFRQWFIEEAKEDWEETPFTKWVYETKGGDWGKETPVDEFTQLVQCIRGTDIADLQNGLPKSTPLRYIKEKKFQSIKPEEGDIVFEISGGTETQSTGRCYFINEEIEQLFEHPLVFSNFCRLLKVRNPKYSYFVYLYLLYLYKADEFFALENGSSGIKNLNYKALLTELTYKMPPDDLVLKFHSKVSTYFSKVTKNKVQVQTLEKLRDTLLPKLMSGEVRVQYQTEEVA